MSVAPKVGDLVTLPIGGSGGPYWIVTERADLPGGAVRLTIEHLLDREKRHFVTLYPKEVA